MDSETLNFDAWQLTHLAQALTRAKRLEALRASFHKQLYECISYKTTTFDRLNPREVSTATDSQAIRIIEAKERYDLKIQNEYDRYLRWQCFLSLATEHDKQIMIRYFQKKKAVRPEVVEGLLYRLKDELDEQETRIEKERTARAARERQEFVKNMKITKPIKRKVSIFEDGQWVLVDPDEHERQQWRKRMDTQREEMRKYFRENFQHQSAL